MDEKVVERKRNKYRGLRRLAFILFILYFIAFLIFTIISFYNASAFRFLASLIGQSSVYLSPIQISMMVFYILLFVGASILAFIIHLDKTPYDNKRTYAICMPISVLILLVLGSSAFGFTTTKTIECVFKNLDETSSITYKSNEGLTYKDYPTAREVEGKVFIGWVDQYGDYRTKIKKGDTTKYVLTAKYKSNSLISKISEFEKILKNNDSEKWEDVRKETISLKPYIQAEKFGYYIHYSAYAEPLYNAKLTLTADGGHTSKYESKLIVYTNIEGANKTAMLSGTATIKANWSKGDTTTSIITGTPVVLAENSILNSASLCVQQAIYVNSELGNKGSVSIVVPEVQVSFSLDLIRGE